MNTNREINIALLNLPIDGNYGGNLQRYALVKTLQKLGHEITFIRVYPKYRVPLWRWPLVITKRLIKKYIFQKPSIIFKEKVRFNNLKTELKNIDNFINNYIPCTKDYTSQDSLEELTNENYNCFIVGSDQTWRASYAKPIEKYFLNFVSDKNTLKIAYAVSFGNDTGSYNYWQKRVCKKLIRSFDAISVRELNGKKIINDYFDIDNVEWLTDPCLLLDKNEYLKLINESTSKKSEGSLFYYILDPNEEKTASINQIAKKKGLKPFTIRRKSNSLLDSVESRIVPPIEDWLQAFYDAEYVITDSYHGVIFSIIFNTPFKTCYNVKRGNSRFESLFSMLGINSDQTESLDWESINQVIVSERERCIDFILRSLR